MKNAKKPTTFFCKKCEFRCNKQSDFTRHLLTAKHKNLQKLDKTGQKNAIYIPQDYKCECGKLYNVKSSFYYHKNKCKNALVVMHSPNCRNTLTSVNMEGAGNDDDKIDLLIGEIKRKDEIYQKERDEHKKEIQLLSEQISKISTITNNTTTNTTNNNKFNLNFFLNTQCKDAMSIQSFMENLQLGGKELEHMGDVGYLTGMIDIFNNTLGSMDIYKRPLHCTDLKREVLYFKQGTDWEKDSEDKQHLKKLIKNVESKNYHNLQDWQNDHPDSRECDTRENQHYMKIATEALGGADFNKDSIYLSKIMKNILKDVQVKSQ